MSLINSCEFFRSTVICFHIWSAMYEVDIRRAYYSACWNTYTLLGFHLNAEESHIYISMYIYYHGIELRVEVWPWVSLLSYFIHSLLFWVFSSSHQSFTSTDLFLFGPQYHLLKLRVVMFIRFTPWPWSWWNGFLFNHCTTGS